VAWYGDTAVPRLADVGGFCAALLYSDRASGRLVSETVWQDPRAGGQPEHGHGGRGGGSG
jgi:hypothetical protein